MEPVYKVGRSTGLIIGKLGSAMSTVRFAGGFRYVDRVLWIVGKFYCLQRGPMYVPIGIRRISDANDSYGCSAALSGRRWSFSPMNVRYKTLLIHFKTTTPHPKQQQQPIKSSFEYFYFNFTFKKQSNHLYYFHCETSR